MSTPTMTAAIGYAARGWAVFPCMPRKKKPATPNGCKNATTDVLGIAHKFHPRGGPANIGLATGAVSGVWVLDVDGAQGFRDLLELEDQHGELPQTLSQSTGGGGRHYFFTVNGVPIGNRQRVGGKSIDVRGTGGYVIVAPSIHPTGVPYRWDSDPAATPIAAAPSWLVDLVARPSKPVVAAPRPVDPGRLDVMDRARRYVATMPTAISGQGGHSATYTVACRLVRDFALDDGDALQLLHEFNERCEPAWSDAELEHKIESAIAATAGEVRGTLLAAERPAAADGVDLSGFAGASRQPDDDPACGPVLTCLADVDPRDVRWLWRDRVPAGRISLLVGVPGAGKSYLTIDMAARVSSGMPWPDGAECERGSVIVISAEDDPHDTIRPRLDAAGADVSRIHLLSGVLLPAAKKGADPVEVMFTLADVDALEIALHRIGDVRLVIVDPIGSYLGGRTDAHKDNEVRGVLAPVAKLAERHGAAVLMVAHRRKSMGGTADDMALGSRAFTGIARSVWHLSSDPETKGRRLLLPGKCNLSAQATGLAFSLAGQPASLRWEAAPVDMHADDGMHAEMQARERPRGPKPEATDGAETWLRSALADGPRAAKDLYDEWHNGQGGSKRTLDRAKRDMGVDSYRETVPGLWWWRLSDSQGCQVDPQGKQLGNLGNLAKNTGFLPFSGSRDSKVAKLNLLGNLGGDGPESGARINMANDAFAMAAEDSTEWGDV